jgi:hypothetical protein
MPVTPLNAFPVWHEANNARLSLHLNIESPNQDGRVTDANLFGQTERTGRPWPTEAKYIPVTTMYIRHCGMV